MIYIIGLGALGRSLFVNFTNRNILTTGVVRDVERFFAKKSNVEFPLSVASVIAFSELSAKKDDVVILAVSDKDIEQTMLDIIAKIESETLVLHCSGATSIEVLSNLHRNVGVLYPLRSFTTGAILDLKNVPLFVELLLAENSEKCREIKDSKESFASNKLILKVIESVFEKVYFINSKERLTLHLSAVFCNNFVNAILGIGWDLLETTNGKIPNEVLLPIIKEHIDKITGEKGSSKDINGSSNVLKDPRELQTGPAKRGDFTTIEKHKGLLDDKNLVLENRDKVLNIYSVLTEFITLIKK